MLLSSGAWYQILVPKSAARVLYQNLVPESDMKIWHQDWVPVSGLVGVGEGSECEPDQDGLQDCKKSASRKIYCSPPIDSLVSTPRFLKYDSSFYHCGVIAED